jgi:hypothetical protein
LRIKRLAMSAILDASSSVGSRYSGAGRAARVFHSFGCHRLKLAPHFELLHDTSTRDDGRIQNRLGCFLAISALHPQNGHGRSSFDTANLLSGS